VDPPFSKIRVSSRGRIDCGVFRDTLHKHDDFLFQGEHLIGRPFFLKIFENFVQTLFSLRRPNYFERHLSNRFITLSCDVSLPLSAWARPSSISFFSSSSISSHQSTCSSSNTFFNFAKRVSFCVCNTRCISSSFVASISIGHAFYIITKIIYI